MHVIEMISELRRIRANLPEPVGLVPTMGALHEGHIALVRTARNENASVISSVFVNPTQFGPDEDFEQYPRDFTRDQAILEAEGVDLIFAPTPEIMYPPGHVTAVEVSEIAQLLEGKHRPGHFRGVATVVTKLFNITQPTTAYFGQKDAQQVAVIRRFAHDLNIPVRIAIHPTIRERDGLALSSRNRYLNENERTAASVLYRALMAAGEQYSHGERDPEALRQSMKDVLDREALADVEYISVADPSTLVERYEATHRPILLSLAVHIGPARLIDNCLLPLSLNKREGLDQTLGNTTPDEA